MKILITSLILLFTFQLQADEPSLNLQLESAAAHGKLEKIRELVKAGAEVNSKEFYSPLSRAAQYNQLGAAKLLVELGADPNITDNYWTRPLVWAIRQRHEKMVHLLFDLGAEINFKSQNGLEETPLEVALDVVNNFGDQGQIDLQYRLYKWLLANGFNIEKFPDRHTHILNAAARYGKKKIVVDIYDTFFDVTDLNKNAGPSQLTPLLSSIFSYYSKKDVLELVEALLKRGADPNLCTPDGGHPLSLAQYMRRPWLEALLIKYGASADKSCSNP